MLRLSEIRIGLMSSASWAAASSPALYLNFLSGSLDSRITFSRGTQATLVDSTGKLTYAPNNLVTYSEQFDNASWTKINATVSADTAVAPNGTTTADKLIGDTAAAGHFIYQVAVPSAALGASYVCSIYIKASGYGFAFVGLNGTGYPAAAYISVNLSTGAVATTNGPVAASAATSVGSGWWRVSLAATTVAAGSVQLDVRPSTDGVWANRNTAQNGSDGVLIWGAQVEQVTYQTTASTYNATTSAAYYGPRFDYDPVTLAPKGLLIEEQRTNLLTYSAQFDNAAWTVTDVTVTANSIVSPDGTSNADTITEGSAGTAFISNGAATTSSATYTSSIFVKRGNTDWLRVGASDGTNSYFVWVNTATGTLGGSSTGGTGVYTASSIVAAANGWYRVTLTGALPLTANGIRVNSATANSSNTRVSGAVYYLYGAQLEAGSFATSYIPTVASTVTRSADVATMTGTNFSSWYNQSAGTLIAEVQKFTPSATSTYAYELLGASSSFSMRIRLATDGRMQSVDGGVVQVDTQIQTPVPATASKYAMAYSVNDYAGAANGGTVGTDTSATVPAISSLSLGSAAVSNLYIRSIRYYPTRLSNAQLQALTA